MSLLAWIVLGLIAGFIANRIASQPDQGLIPDALLGIVGAVAGGWLFSQFGMAGITGFNLYSLLVAIVGAALLIWAYHAISRRST